MNHHALWSAHTDSGTQCVHALHYLCRLTSLISGCLAKFLQRFIGVCRVTQRFLQADNLISQKVKQLISLALRVATFCGSSISDWI